MFSDELFIAQEHIPAVIGPKGAHLQAITTTTSCRVDLPKKGTVRTHALITGPSNAAVAQAMRALKQLITKVPRQKEDCSCYIRYIYVFVVEISNIATQQTKKLQHTGLLRHHTRRSCG